MPRYAETGHPDHHHPPNHLGDDIMTDTDQTPAFTVEVSPRTVQNPEVIRTGSGFRNVTKDRTVYDIHAHGLNAEQLVFSNQGYENRADAVDLARRIFRPPFTLRVFGADNVLVTDDVVTA